MSLNKKNCMHRNTKVAIAILATLILLVASGCCCLMSNTDGGLSDEEKLFLQTIYAQAGSVFEWGVGSSTLIAERIGVKRFVGVDSAAEWINIMQEKVQNANYVLRHVDIGPVKMWGYPHHSSLHTWPSYSMAVDAERGSFDAYFVDGRFRVACACRALLHGHAESLVLVHDFERQHYHVLFDIALKVHQVGKLVVLRRKPGVSDATILDLWRQFQADPK